MTKTIDPKLIPYLRLALKAEEVPIAKPYSSNGALPDSVKDNLPEGAQTVWRKAFNSALQTYNGDEGAASRVAWAAVRRAGYSRDADGNWVKKANDATKGAMVALWPTSGSVNLLLKDIPGEIAEPEEQLHLTFAYFGKADDLTDEQRLKIDEVTRTFADGLESVTTKVTGWARFVTQEGEDDAIVALVSNPEIAKMRDQFVAALEAEGIEYSRDFAFVPHVTVAYMRKEDVISVPGFVPEEIKFDRITRTFAEDRQHYGIGVGDAIKARYAVSKTNAEKHYTLGPVYLPGTLDAHEEFIVDDDLHEAIWKYVRKDDRRIHLQHTKEIVGEWVEILRWPFPVTADLIEPQSDGTVKKGKMKFPAGTVFMGCIWEPKAWEKVKNGELTGYSIGGKAQRLEVEFDEEK